MNTNVFIEWAIRSQVPKFIFKIIKIKLPNRWVLYIA